MTIVRLLPAPGRDHIRGKCAACGVEVWESIAILDDAYNVWVGKCPACNAYNRLALTSLRGYSSRGMDLVLPTDEEREANGWPAEIPTLGACGRPADVHGTVSGELQHKLRNPIR